MKKLYFLLLGLSFLAAGCVVRTYPLTRDRVDQELTGNRGYIQGTAPAAEAMVKPTTRTTRVVEIELHSPIKFDRAPKVKPAAAAEPVAAPEESYSSEGNKGYIAQSIIPEVEEPQQFQNYTVQKNDTLQKISLKFYGTTKNWNKLYEANKDVLKSPNKVYPGQTLRIPQGNSGAGLKVPEKLK